MLSSLPLLSLLLLQLSNPCVAQAWLTWTQNGVLVSMPNTFGDSPPAEPTRPPMGRPPDYSLPGSAPTSEPPYSAPPATTQPPATTRTRVPPQPAPPVQTSHSTKTPPKPKPKPSHTHAETHGTTPKPKPKPKPKPNPKPSAHHSSSGVNNAQPTHNPNSPQVSSGPVNGSPSGQNNGGQSASSDGGSNGMAVGLGVGLGLLAAIIIGGVAFYFFKKRRNLGGDGDAESFNEEGNPGMRSIENLAATNTYSTYAPNAEPTLPAVVANPSPRNSYAPSVDPFLSPEERAAAERAAGQQSQPWAPKIPSRLSQIPDTLPAAENPPQYNIPRRPVGSASP